MRFLSNPFVLIIGGIILFWFIFMWLPFQLHILRVALRFGTPHEKRSAIIGLFREGELFVVGYVGASPSPREEVSLMIGGPWGQYVRAGFGNKLEDDPSSQKPPPEVAKAFEGYIDRPGDIAWLLCSVPFVERLQKEVLDIRTSNIWNLEAFTIFKKGCRFVKEVDPGSPLENILLRVKS